MKFIMDTEYTDVRDYMKHLVKYGYKHKEGSIYDTYGINTVEINTLEELLQLMKDINEDFFITDEGDHFEIFICDDQCDTIREVREEQILKGKAKEIVTTYNKNNTRCPTCREDLSPYKKDNDKDWKPKCCPNCGQKILWD